MKPSTRIRIRKSLLLLPLLIGMAPVAFAAQETYSDDEVVKAANTFFANGALHPDLPSLGATAVIIHVVAVGRESAGSKRRGKGIVQ